MKDHLQIRVTTRSLSGFGWASTSDLSVNELFLACGFALVQVRLKERRQCGSASGEGAVPTPVQLRFSERDTQASEMCTESTTFERHK